MYFLVENQEKKNTASTRETVSGATEVIFFVQIVSTLSRRHTIQ